MNKFNPYKYNNFIELKFSPAKVRATKTPNASRENSDALPPKAKQHKEVRKNYEMNILDQYKTAAPARQSELTYVKIKAI